MTSAMTSRRRFLSHGAQTLGLLTWLGGRPDRAPAADDPAKRPATGSASASRLIERGIGFLRP